MQILEVTVQSLSSCLRVIVDNDYLNIAATLWDLKILDKNMNILRTIERRLLAVVRPKKCEIIFLATPDSKPRKLLSYLFSFCCFYCEDSRVYQLNIRHFWTVLNRCRIFLNYPSYVVFSAFRAGIRTRSIKLPNSFLFLTLVANISATPITKA